MSTGLLILHVSHWLAAFLLLGIAIYGLLFSRRSTVRALSCFCALTGLWALLSALIVATPDLADKIALNRIKLVAPALLPLSVLSVTMALHGKRPWHKYLWMACAIVPLITVLLLASPSHHELFVGGYSLMSLKGFDLLAFSNGPWFAAHNLNARLLVALSIVLLVAARRDLSPAHRYRVWLVILAILIPFVGDTLAVHAMEELRFVQITPTMLLVSAFVMIYSIMRHHFIDVVPFAREHILDSTGDMCLVFDADDVLVDFNARAKNDLHLSRKDIGKRLARLSASHPHLEVLSQVQLREWSLRGETFEINRHVLLDPRSERLGSVLAFKNVTLRKQTELALENLNQIKTKLLAVIGHDFQGNQAASLVIAQSLARNIGTMRPEDVQEGLQNLQNIATESISLIEGLLDWSKYRLGAGLDRELVDLNNVATKVCDFLQPISSVRNITIETQSECLTPIRTDGASITTILRNLLSNAIRFSPVDGRILLRMRPSDADIEIMVEDHGPGIERSRWATLFDLKKDKSGGIGLFLCREFAESFGGRVWVESEVGRGSRFFVSLPTADS